MLRQQMSGTHLPESELFCAFRIKTDDEVTKRTAILGDSQAQNINAGGDAYIGGRTLKAHKCIGKARTIHMDSGAMSPGQRCNRTHLAELISSTGFRQLRQRNKAERRRMGIPLYGATEKRLGFIDIQSVRPTDRGGEFPPAGESFGGASFRFHHMTSGVTQNAFPWRAKTRHGKSVRRSA